MKKTTSEAIRPLSDHTIVAEPSPVGFLVAEPGDVTADTDKQRNPDEEGEGNLVIPYQPPMVAEENPHPLKPAVYRRGRRSLIKKIVRGLWSRRPGRPPTPEERVEQAEKIEARKLEARLRDDANKFKATILNRLNGLGICYRYPRSQKDLFLSGLRSVKFDKIRFSANAIFMRVNTRRLPRNVNILDLVAEEVITDLSLACGKVVRAKYNPEIGCWYMIERAAGVMGIPAHVLFADMFETFPSTADELTIPLGKTSNGKRVYRSLKDMPHLLIAGATDSGKSNGMNVIICTLLLRNSPDDLKFVLIDLKGGMEFTFYEGIPHLLGMIHSKPDEVGEVKVISKTGIIYDREKVPDLFDWLIHEGEKRMDLLKKSKHKNISSYNRNRKCKLYRLVVVIDEWADVKLVSSIGKKSEERLTNLASRMRAVGIHVIVATQSPKTEVISTLIKTNLPAKMAYACPSNTASELILDNGKAKGLVPQGRFIYQKGNEELQIQAPFMSDSLVNEIVKKVKTGETTIEMTAKHDVTEQEIMEWAIDNLGGKLPFRQLFEHFRERGISKEEIIRMLDAWDNRQFIIRENVYEVIPGGGARPRMLRLANSDSQTENKERDV